MVMTFCKARFTKNHKWELSRLCSKASTNVIGGPSKLFKYFVNNYMKIGEKVVTYNDIGKSKGTVYSLLGFSLLKISKPSYVWWNGITLALV